jgi:hypothetical protein
MRGCNGYDVSSLGCTPLIINDKYFTSLILKVPSCIERNQDVKYLSLIIKRSTTETQNIISITSSH